MGFQIRPGLGSLSKQWPMARLFGGFDGAPWASFPVALTYPNNTPQGLKFCSAT